MDFEIKTAFIADEIKAVLNEENLDMLLKVLDEAKKIQFGKNSIEGICCYNQEQGEFLPVIIRGTSKGILRRVSGDIETKSLHLEEIACKFAKINQRFDQKEMNEFKMHCEGHGLDKALYIARIWRKGFQSIFDENASKSFSDSVQKIINQPIPYHMLQLLVRFLPPSLPELFHQEIKNIDKYITTLGDFEFPENINYWPPFVSILAGISCKSAMKSINEYILDLIAIASLCVGTIREQIAIPINERVLSDLSDRSHSLFTVTKTLNLCISELFTERVYFPIYLYKYEFPLSVSSIYLLENSGNILGKRENFSLASLETWLSLCISIALKNLISKFPLETNSSCPNLAKLLVNINQSSAAIYMLDVLQEKNAATEYIKGIAYYQKRDMRAKNVLLNVDALLDYDMEGKSIQDFSRGPWIKNYRENLGINNQGGLQVAYHDILYNSVADFETKKEIGISNLSSSSLISTDYEYMKHCFAQLIKQKEYNLAYSLLLSIEDEAVLYDCTEAMLDLSCQTKDFHSFLSLPLTDEIKKIVIHILNLRAQDDHFNIANEKFPSILFQNVIPNEENSKSLS